MKMQFKSLTVALLKIIEWVMAVIGAELILVVAYGVLKRYIFKSPLKWSYELSILSFLWVSFLGAAAALKTNHHIQFDWIVDILPSKIAEMVMVIRDLVILCILVPGVVYGFIIFSNTFAQSFQTLPLSLGWMYLALPVGLILMSIFMIEIFVEDLGILMNKKLSTHKE